MIKFQTKTIAGMSVLLISALSMANVTIEGLYGETPCFTPTYTEKENLVPHPECDDLNGFGGWGTKSINTDSRYVYCGDKSILRR